DVMEVDFKLAGGRFGDDGVSGDALLMGSLDDVLEKLSVFVQVIHGVNLHRIGAFAGDRRARWLRPAGNIFLIDQEKFQFEGRNRFYAQLSEALHHSLQHVPRVGEERRFAIQLVHGHQQLPGRALLPGLDAEGAGDRQADAVGIADFHTETGFLDGGALDVQGEYRGWQGNTALEGLDQGRAVDPLATYDAVHVGNQQIDEMDFRIRLEKGFGFLHRGRNDVPSVKGDDLGGLGTDARDIGLKGHDGHLLFVKYINHDS